MQAERGRERERGEVRVGSNLTCPLCLELLTSLAQLEVCPQCRSIHHTACVAEMRRCGTIGCTGFAASRRAAPVPAGERVLAALAWGGNMFLPLLGPVAVWLIAWSQGFGFARRQARNAVLLALALIGIATLGIEWLDQQAVARLLFGLTFLGFAATAFGMLRALRDPGRPGDDPGQARLEAMPPGPAPAKQPFDPPTPTSELGSDASTR